MRLAGHLALFVTGFHCDADVWSCRVNGTRIIFAKELAWLAASDVQALAFLVKLRHERVVGHIASPIAYVGTHKVWFA